MRETPLLPSKGQVAVVPERLDCLAFIGVQCNLLLTFYSSNHINLRGSELVSSSCPRGQIPSAVLNGGHSQSEWCCVLRHCPKMCFISCAIRFSNLDLASLLVRRQKIIGLSSTWSFVMWLANTLSICYYESTGSITCAFQECALPMPLVLEAPLLLGTTTSVTMSPQHNLCFPRMRAPNATCP